uniref:VHS domain-containing protein n=1 Tax=Oncorhynchus mykiss TaxID=8022 RepID=A0A8C7QFV7_ONCMY
MAAPPEEESLESRVNKATNPLNKEADWDSIQGFCEQLNNEPEGPQLATRLLAHKIQSPQEWEAMQALMVLEMCMKNCGKRFHNEVGKFRFLNELIKVVSPKYLGTRAPEPVKKKVLEVMFSWTVGLPDEPKIADAYQMLKKQGIVKQDPVLPDEPLPPPPPRTKSVIFEDEEKSKMLSRLLNSTHPEDLRAANKLIKEMVQEDQKRMEKVSKRVNAIQEVKESVGLLTQLLGDYSKESSSQSNQELIKDLYQSCEKMRPTLFRLASDTEDNDEALADILQANDSLTQVINLYRQLVKGEEVNGDSTAMPTLPGESERGPHQSSQRLHQGGPPLLPLKPCCISLYPRGCSTSIGKHCKPERQLLICNVNTLFSLKKADPLLSLPLTGINCSPSPDPPCETSRPSPVPTLLAPPPPALSWPSPRSSLGLS